MTKFDPEKIDYYNAPWAPQKAEGRERHQQWVQAQDYDQLLKLYDEVVECFKVVSGKYNWLRDGVSE